MSRQHYERVFMVRLSVGHKQRAFINNSYNYMYIHKNNLSK